MPKVKIFVVHVGIAIAILGNNILTPCVFFLWLAGGLVGCSVFVSMFGEIDILPWMLIYVVLSVIGAYINLFVLGPRFFKKRAPLDFP